MCTHVPASSPGPVPMPTTLHARRREQERWQKSEGKEKKNVEQTGWIQNKLRRKGKKWKRREGTQSHAARVAVGREQLRSDYEAVEGVLSEIGQKFLTQNMHECGSLSSWDVFMCVFWIFLLGLGSAECTLGSKSCISKCGIRVLLKLFLLISKTLESICVFKNTVIAELFFPPEIIVVIFLFCVCFLLFMYY